MKMVARVVSLTAVLAFAAAEGETLAVSSLATALDTRTFRSVRKVSSVDEMLPLAYSNDPDWSRGGLTGGTPATLVVTPVQTVAKADATVYRPKAPSKTVASVAGEGVVSGWAESNGSYRVTLGAGAEVRDEVVFALTGETVATLALSNSLAPTVGKALALTLTDGSDASPKVLEATWTRVDWDGTRETGTVVAAKATRYEPTAEDYEHWLDVTDTACPDCTYRIWFSKLPVVYVTTSNGLDPISKNVELSGTLHLQGNGKWTDGDELYTGELANVHVRGNTTSSYPKKPYKLKLGKKANLLGMGKNKHWVLLANYQDPGLMRNKTAYDLSGQLGLTYMASEWVDVILNGNFVGNYQLCEHIRIDKTRVNIQNWEDTAETTATALAKKLIAGAGAKRDALAEGLTDSMTADLAWLTSGSHTFTNGVTYNLADYGIDVSSFDLSGGYLYELDHYNDMPSRFCVTTGVISNLPVKIASPETLKTNTRLLDEQRTLWTEFFASLQSESGYADGKSWVELADARSMAAYWLTQVVLFQLDTVWSRYAYRPQGSPIVFGPVWDFDNSVGGRAGDWTSPTELPDDAKIGWPRITSSRIAKQLNFYPLWIEDPYFCLVLWELWQEHRNFLLNLTAAKGDLQNDYAYLLESGRANDARWPVATQSGIVFPFEGTNGNAQSMIRIIGDEIAWIDGQMTSLGKLVKSLNTDSLVDHPYTNSPSMLKMAFPEARVRLDSSETETPDVVVASGTVVTGTVAAADAATKTVEVYVNGLAVSTNAVADGAAEFAIPARFLTAATGHRNLVALLSRDGSGARRHTTYALVETSGLDRFPLEPADLTVSVDSSSFGPTDPTARPVVTVTAPNGTALVEGRDYDVRFSYGGDLGGEVIVTGRGNYSGAGLGEDQINFVGTKTEFFVFNSVRARAVGTAALDTRSFVPRRILGAASEALPFAYDTAWWPGAAAIAALTVAPLANGVAETARQVAVPVTNAVGTGPWAPTHREIYRAEIRTTDGATETVDLDLTGVKELAVMGTPQANGDIVFERLRDAAGREATLELPDDWLDARSVSRTAARDTLRLGANGIPVWQSYVLGLDPADETSLPTVRIVPTDANTFRVEVEGLDDLSTDRVSLTFELLSTDDLDKAFESDRAEQREETFAELPRNGPRRFYRPRVRIYWKGADK